MAATGGNWQKYLFEFVSIFVAVIAAFSLDKCNSDRRDANAEEKILQEIAHGLRKDQEDLRVNMQGHRNGIAACAFWRRALAGDTVQGDSLPYWLSAVLRDFISIQNSSGYQSLRSRGLELVADDSLRSDIIALYEFDMAVIAKLEENYGEMQFFTRHGPMFSRTIGARMVFNESGIPVGVDLADLPAAERNELLLALWRIEYNRGFILLQYQQVEQRITALTGHIERVLAAR